MHPTTDFDALVAFAKRTDTSDVAQAVALGFLALCEQHARDRDTLASLANEVEAIVGALPEVERAISNVANSAHDIARELAYTLHKGGK